MIIYHSWIPTNCIHSYNCASLILHLLLLHTHLLTHTHTHPPTHPHTHTHIHTHTHTLTHIHTPTHTHTPIHIHTHTHKHTVTSRRPRSGVARSQSGGTTRDLQIPHGHQEEDFQGTYVLTYLRTNNQVAFQTF